MGRIIFTRTWAAAPITRGIHGMLAAAFPEHGIETVDVGRLLKRDRRRLAAAGAAWLREYHRDLFTGGRPFKGTVFQTPYAFRALRTAATDAVRGGWDELAFTFQWQSLFDASLPGVPHVVYTDHTALTNLDYPGFDPRRLPSRRWIELERSIYEHASLVLTWSEHVGRTLLERYGCSPEKVRRVFTGANATVGGALRNDGYRSRNVLFVGADWERKGGPILIEAFRRVLRSCPEARLTIVGSSPEVDLPNCRIVGRVPVEEVNRYFEEASIFCLPTRLEPFGTVYVEALAHALPVVATRVGAAPDLVLPGRTGYLVEPEDVSGLARRLLQLLENPGLCRRLGESGRRLVAERYTWEAVGRAVRAAVEPILTSRTGS